MAKLEVMQDRREAAAPGTRVVRPARFNRAFTWLESVALYLRTMIVFAAIWYAAALWIGNSVLLPTPVAVAKSFVTLAADGEMAMHFFASVRRLLFSFVLAGVVGIPLGLLMGLNRTAFELFDPLIELLRPISGIAWIPLGLFIFGVGESLPTFIMFYGAFFPMVINTVVSVRSVDRNFIDAARTLGADRIVVLRHVVLPAALPGILVGARLAAGAGWMSMVAAELIGAPSGLGFAVEWYRELLMTSNVLAFIVLIGVLGYLFDRVLRLAQHRFARWSQVGADT